MKKLEKNPFKGKKKYHWMIKSMIDIDINTLLVLFFLQKTEIFQGVIVAHKEREQDNGGYIQNWHNSIGLKMVDYHDLVEKLILKKCCQKYD